MKLLTSEKMKLLDRAAIDGAYIPSSVLMEHAAAHLAEAAGSFLSEENRLAAVFCGSGNNGGDGIAAAYILKNKGFSPRVFLVGSRDRMTADARKMLGRLEKFGGSLEAFDASSDEIKNYVNRCGVIIDAIFGIGLRGAMRGSAVEAIKLINASQVPVVAADIASGVETDTGKVIDIAVRADITVTFTCAKPGHFLEPGCIYSGEVRVSDIGIPDLLARSFPPDTFAVFGEDISLPVRRRDTHKGNYGRCLIIGGSTGYTGAPCFSAKAASRSGAGLIYLGVPRDIYTVAAVKCDEAMPFPLPCDENGFLTMSAADTVLQKLEASNVCLVGPGLGRSAGVSSLVYSIIKNSKVPLILDADGINAVAENIDILDGASCPVILTPHAGEYARLGGDLSSGDRCAAAREFATRHHCTLVLKGHRTVTALPDGKVYINTTGNPGMAKGGSGDVLAGMITALVGQGFPLSRAVVTAVWLHGRSGDLAAKHFGEYSMTPGDMINLIGEAIGEIIV